jgi:hypothetical protein
MNLRVELAYQGARPVGAAVCVWLCGWRCLPPPARAVLLPALVACCRRPARCCCRPWLLAAAGPLAAAASWLWLARRLGTRSAVAPRMGRSGESSYDKLEREKKLAGREQKERDKKKKGRDTPKHLNKAGPSQEKREAQLARHTGSVRIGAKTSAVVLDLLRVLEQEKEERLAQAAAARAAAPPEQLLDPEPAPEPAPAPVEVQEREAQPQPDPIAAAGFGRGRPAAAVPAPAVPAAALAAGFGRGRGRGAAPPAAAASAPAAAAVAGFGRGRGRGQPVPEAWAAPAAPAAASSDGSAASSSGGGGSASPRDPGDMPPQGLSQKERQEWLKRRTRKQEKDKARAARRGGAEPAAPGDDTRAEQQPAPAPAPAAGGLEYEYKSSKYAGFESSSSWTPATSLVREKSPFLRAILCTESEHLPRQARDKHKKSVAITACFYRGKPRRSRRWSPTRRTMMMHRCGRRLFFACLFNTEVDHFAKTDSGQTHIYRKR